MRRRSNTGPDLEPGASNVDGSLGWVIVCLVCSVEGTEIRGALSLELGATSVALVRKPLRWEYTTYDASMIRARPMVTI